MDVNAKWWTNETLRTRDQFSDDHYTSVLSYEGDIWAGVYLMFISLIAFIGNISVIVISLRKREKLKPIDLLTINLAIADFLICVVSYPLPMISAFRHRWSFGKFGCVWYGFTSFLFAVGSMATLMVIALLRYAKLCRENVDQYQSRPFVIKVIVAIWGFAFFTTAPPLFGWSSYVPEPYHLSCTIDFADTSPSGLSYTYFTTIVVFFMPLMIIVLCYVAIARKMIHHNRRINVGHNAGRMLLEIRLLKTACMITMAYTISWTPYAVIAMWVTYIPVNQIPDAFRILPAFCAKTSSVYNPIIYCIFNKSFRQDLSSLICCCACQCYTITINLDINSHAQQQFRRIEERRDEVGTYKRRPLMICSNPFAWSRDFHETWRQRRIRGIHRNCRNNVRVENINVNFRRDTDMVELNAPTPAEIHRPELNTASTRSGARTKSMATHLPALEEVPSGAPQCSALLHNTPIPRSLQGTPLPYQPQPSTSDLHDEFLNPSVVSRNMCVIVVKPNIEEELSTD
ncbi:opsin-5 [Strongylocentrotus purpuratus]|uniref:G-protein coupled receptors family 1 profile domain-containing protein n=1 Tax=Strongylocentrotus purpuratus TaxID=7668 RepID=A0A7M7G154_STRPU|nr:opsin-5 [Strongylocentrotus purpuratus]|eukprot:XP_001199309.1 PREDICTED: opsin-5 [Strongylocentrotus purpuratus]